MLAQDSTPLNRLENQTPNRLLIANSTGVITGTAVSGDVSSASPGVFRVNSVQDDAIDTSAIQADAVTGPKIATNAIDGDHIQTDAIDGSEILAGAITNAKLNLTWTEQTQTADTVNIEFGSWASCISVTPTAGTYIFIGTVCASTSASGSDNAVRIRFSTDVAGGAIGRGAFVLPAVGAGGTGSVLSLVGSATIVTVQSFNGSTAIALQARRHVDAGSASAIQSAGGSSDTMLTKMWRCRVGIE
jgi:hypothetical protein